MRNPLRPQVLLGLLLAPFLGCATQSIHEASWVSLRTQGGVVAENRSVGTAAASKCEKIFSKLYISSGLIDHWPPPPG